MSRLLPPGQMPRGPPRTPWHDLANLAEDLDSAAAAAAEEPLQRMAHVHGLRYVADCLGAAHPTIRRWAIDGLLTLHASEPPPPRARQAAAEVLLLMGSRGVTKCSGSDSSCQFVSGAGDGVLRPRRQVARAGLV